MCASHYRREARAVDFKRRLDELMKVLNVDRQTIAEVTGVSKQAISHTQFTSGSIMQDIKKHYAATHYAATDYCGISHKYSPELNANRAEGSLPRPLCQMVACHVHATYMLLQSLCFRLWRVVFRLWRNSLW